MVDDVFESVDEAPDLVNLDAHGESVVIDADTQSESTASAIVRAADVLPATLHVLPLAHRPFFPVQAMPLVLPADPWIETLEAVAATPHRMIGLALTRTEASEPPTADQFHDVGTIARVHNVVRVFMKQQVHFIASLVKSNLTKYQQEMALSTLLLDTVLLQMRKEID